MSFIQETVMAQRTVFITGATSGIGFATALKFDAMGWRVFAGAYPGEDVQPLIDGSSDRLIVVPIDITEQKMIDKAKRIISEELAGRHLYGLINNAGILTGGPVEAVQIDTIRRQLEVNLFGHIAVTQAMLPLIRRGNKGHIVNVTSLSGHITMPFIGAYSMSKSAMEAFTDSLRLELAPWNIHVSAVTPGNVHTRLTANLESQFEEQRQSLPQEMRILYGENFRKVNTNLGKTTMGSSSPEDIANTISRAMTANRPRARYRVGTDARLLLFLKSILPQRWFDNILKRSMGIT